MPATRASSRCSRARATSSRRRGPFHLPFAGDLASFGTLGFSVDVVGANGGIGHVWMSLAQAQQLVDPTQDPTLFFGHPQTYLVAVLGDPQATHFGSSGTYDGTGLHLLVVTAPPAPAPADAATPAVDP